MRRTAVRISIAKICLFLSAIAVMGLSSVMLSCYRQAAQPKPAPSQPSAIKVEVRDGGPVVITTSTAEYQILPSGFVQATLLKDGQRLTLDAPGPTSTGGSDSIIHEGKEIDFIPD